MQVDLDGAELLVAWWRARGITVRPVATAAANAVYVHDRRHGERRSVAAAAPPVLPRHELDELYNLSLVEALELTVSVLGGPDEAQVVPPDTYQRLARDLPSSGVRVVVDLSGRNLTKALAGGVSSPRPATKACWRTGSPPRRIGARWWRRRIGSLSAARSTSWSRAPATPALALIDGQLIEVIVPSFEPVDHRGGGSCAAGIAAALADGGPIEHAVRLGAAARALTRCVRPVTGCIRRGRSPIRQYRVSPSSQAQELRG